MTQHIDTAAIREFYSKYPDDTALALCAALDATRAYAKAAKDEHTKALARIAAALAERCEGPMCECCDMVLGALTGGTP